MNILIIFLGSIYFFIGFIFLIVPLFYLELGRPKDLIRASLNLLIGLILIVKSKVFGDSFLLILVLITTLALFYLVDTCLFRWNQLTDTEKNKLTTFMEFKKNFLKILEAITLGVNNCRNFLNFANFGLKDKNINTKKWVRNHKNDNM